MRYVSDFGAFEVSPTPGQPQLAHCHGFFIVPAGRGKGLGTSQKVAQMKVLTDELFDYATCTVDSNNAAQKRVLAKTGWKLLDTFDNSRTGGKTELWGWDVGAAGDEEVSTDLFDCGECPTTGGCPGQCMKKYDDDKEWL